MKRGKVLILGSTGMLGHMVYIFLKENMDMDLYDISFQRKINKKTIILDARNFVLLEKTIRKINPDYIINCIGVLIKGSGVNPANAIHLNSLLPQQLSSLCKDAGIKLIHISTDCVFSGKKGNYKVDDFRDSDDIYGRSKALGELINDYDITIRTSIIGPEIKIYGEGLFHWFLSQKDQVFGFENVFWSGLTTLELAKQINNILKNPNKGLIQLSPANKISKLNLLIAIREVFELKTEIIPKKTTYSDKSLIASEGFSLPNYKEMIIELKDFMIKNKKIYEVYDF